jgi:hypothetical protein
MNDDYQPPSLALADAYISVGSTLIGLAHIPLAVSKLHFATSTEDNTKAPHKR